MSSLPTAPRRPPTEDGAAPRRRIVLTTLAWGESYVEKLLTLTLPAVLAPGNYPALAAAFECEVVVVTEQRLFSRIRESDAMLRLGRLGATRLVPLDDLLIGPGSYGLTLSLAFFRVIESFGPAMVDTHFLFLNADFVLADGSYEHLIPLIRGGERVICAPSYCVDECNVLPALRRRVDKAQGTLTLAKREMARLLLNNLHDTVRGQIADACYHYDDVYIYHAYSRPDPDTLLGHQMPVSVVALRPTVHAKALSTFWDWGVVSELCPGELGRVLGDSDEFLMLELRHPETGREYLRLGSPSPEHIASRLSRVLTRDQRYFGDFPLTLHVGELTAEHEAARVELGRFREQMLKRLPALPAKHLHHPHWEHHYALYLQPKPDPRPLAARMDAVASSRNVKTPDSELAEWMRAHYLGALKEVAAEQVTNFTIRVKREILDFFRVYYFADGQVWDVESFREKFREILIRHEEERAALEEAENAVTKIVHGHLAELKAPPPDDAGVIDDGEGAATAAALEEIGPRAPLATSSRGFRLLYQRMFGHAPYVSWFHPYSSVFRSILGVLDRYSGPLHHALIVSDLRHSAMQATLCRRFARVVRLSTSDALRKHIALRANVNLCFLELAFSQLPHVREIFERLRPVMAPGGKFIAFALNEIGARVPGDAELVRGALSVDAPVKVYYGGSEPAAQAIADYVRAREALAGSLLTRGVVGVLAAFRSILRAAQAGRWETRQPRDPATVVREHCTHLIVEIDVLDSDPKPDS